MATCSRCRKPITSVQGSRAEKVLNDAGQIIGMRHGKCKRLDDRAERKSKDDGRAGKDAPSAYEASQQFGTDRRQDPEYLALQARQAEIAEQRALEEPPTREDDWRDPIEAGIDELVATGDAISLDDILAPKPE